MEKPNPLEEILEDLNRRAREMPPEKFFDYVERLVEDSRRHIQAQKDEEIRESLLALYGEIVKFAFACKMEQLQALEPMLVHSGGARC